MIGKHILKVFAASLVLCGMCGCKDRKPSKTEAEEQEQSMEEADKTLYGVCGDATTMSVLQLITDLGDTLDISLVDSNDNAVEVKGGLLAGDRMAVLKDDTQEGNVAANVVNITSLLGRWSSIDKDFVIQEGGVVESSVKAEHNTWVSWKLHNGKLLLNKDTFDINTLGSDSLYLENDKGIYVYIRRKQNDAGGQGQK